MTTEAEKGTPGQFDNRSPFTWRATTTALLALVLVVVGASIVISSGAGVGWTLLVIGLVAGLTAAWIFHLGRKAGNRT
ncbi:hypothetical protein [Kibdelosporangium phytohabitans]|uniref:Uncharacterized protein n=1 Tax=Kibdelosporangium phytohabitans TaxID=860235 RepID=A0A0N9I3I2_9PSEU|nr:hypothetical protein [Kibdelosporangium phytohabitans]ALG13304.1 hypothetical protein AOZ06_46345 [Kibdelosporangium phytohabitans]MBE1465082.1 hypothetical protein [Kibdelosporangium phytohabitans]